VDPRSPFAIDIHQLGRRPGAMKRLARVLPAPGDLANEVISVPQGWDIIVELSLESVMDGVYVTGTARAQTAGECVRCLDPVGATVEAELQELYFYEAPEPVGDAEELDALRLVDGDYLDLEPALRDAIVTALPFQPVCRPECPGLCSRCGARLAEEPDHSHDEADPRWAVLQQLDLTADKEQ